MPKSISSYSFAIPHADTNEEKWRVVYHAIQNAILDGRLLGGTRLPATRELARDLKFARGTVVQAYDLLMAEGLLRSVVGRGAFVADGVQNNFDRALKRKHKTIPLSDRGGGMVSSPYPLTVRAKSAVPFAPFLPALDEFPLETWRRLSIVSARETTAAEMRDGDAQGYRPLRDVLKSYLRLARGVRCEADNIFIFSSTMQALDMCLRLFTDEGDFVACEDPCYRGATALFRANQLNVVAIPVDESGMAVELLPAKKRAVRLIYVTPAHQAPLGSVLSASRRIHLIKWAAKTLSLVFEDDYDGEYRYDDHLIPALQTYDEYGVVFHSGSFSKTLFPALRLSYLVVPDPYVDAMCASRSMTSRYAGISDQITLTRFIAEGHFPRHLAKMRKLYSERRYALSHLFSRYINGAANLSAVEAGLQTVCKFNVRGTERAILEKLRLSGLDVHGVEDYRLNIKLPPMCVLGFSAFNPAELKTGVIRMANVLEKERPSDV